jgi:hypothetical protein
MRTFLFSFSACLVLGTLLSACESAVPVPSATGGSRASSDGGTSGAASSGGKPDSAGGASSGGKPDSVGGASSGGAFAASGGYSGEALCAGLSELECNAMEVCRPALGWRPAPGSFEGGDFEDRSFQGCRYGGPPDNELLCGSALTCGYDPNAGVECWEFSNNCLPIGWNYVNCTEPCPIGGEGEGGAGGAR